MKKLRYGFVSTAEITARMLGAIRSTEHSEVWAISSRSLEKAQAYAEKYGIPKAYGSQSELFADAEVELVYIALPNDLHYSATKEALLAGKHVLCEKPFVLRALEAKELFELAESRGLFLMEAQKAVFLPTTLYVKAAKEDLRFGPLNRVVLESQFHGRLPEGHWMTDPHQGGALIPSSSYSLELLSFLFDSEPERLDYLIHRDEYGMVDEVLYQMRYPGQVLAQASVSTRTPAENVSRFYFERAQIDVPHHWKARELLIRHWPEGRKERLLFPVEYEMVYEVDHVYACIRNGRITSDVMTAARTLACVSYVEKIQAKA